MAGDAADVRLVFAGSRLWNLHRPLLDSLSFAHGRSRAGKNARQSRFNCMSPVVASRSFLGMPSASTLTRRPAPGVLRLGFGAWRIACDKNGQPHRRLESHVCEKLFNDGEIRHHARSFRNQLRIVASGMAGKHFV